MAFTCFKQILLLNFILKRGSLKSSGSNKIDLEHRCNLPEILKKKNNKINMAIIKKTLHDSNDKPKGI
jgi:hypothetical protein